MSKDFVGISDFFIFDKAYDYEKNEYKQFDSWYSAVAFAQRNGIKKYEIVKVDGHYEIH